MRNVENLKTENSSLKRKMQKLSTKLDEPESKTKLCDAKLVSATSNSLIYVEEKTKLKKRIDVLSSEKSELIAKMVQNTCNTGILESKIESEIESLKDLLLIEIKEVKTQINKSVNLPNNLGNSIRSFELSKNTVRDSQIDRTNQQNPANRDPLPPERNQPGPRHRDSKGRNLINQQSYVQGVSVSPVRNKQNSSPRDTMPAGNQQNPVHRSTVETERNQ